MPKGTVKLGLMSPLTGVVSLYGEEISRAAQIACQEVNEKGGVLGLPLQLVIEDDGSLPESSVTAAEKLLDQHHCSAIIGSLLSNSRIAVAYNVAEPRKVPYLNFSFSEGSILSRYFFHFAALPNQQIDHMIPYMCQKYGSRMFFAGNNYEWPRGSIHAAKLALERAGGDVVGEEYCPLGVNAKTIERLLDNVEAAAPDVFVPYFAGIDQVQLLTRFSQRGMKQRIAVVMGHYDEIMASVLSAEVREGFYSSNTYFMSMDTAENQSYMLQLAKLPGVTGIWPNGNGILTHFGEGAYVCVKAFAKAANLAGSLDPEALVTALETISVEAPQGLVQMTPTHHHAQVNTCLSRCEANGQFTIIKKFGAIEPLLPKRYRHQEVGQRASLEEDVRLQARMLEQLSDGVLLISIKDYTILYANPGADRLFGFGEGAMIGQSVIKLSNSFDRNQPNTAAEIHKILQMKGEWQGEIRYIKQDGTPVWCSSTISTFTHPTYGEVWLSVNHNITELKRAETQLKKSFGDIVRAMSAMGDTADPYTAGHELRVAKIAEAIALEMGLNEFQTEGVRLGAQIHDIGKISTPIEILSKQGKLNEQEYSLVKLHAQVGYDMIKGFKFPWPLAEIIHQHHERMDGSGYPQGLKGNQICLEARIVAVADVVEPMSSHRPYRPDLGLDMAVNEIKAHRGSLYWPDAVDAFLRLVEKKKLLILLNAGEPE